MRKYTFYTSRGGGPRSYTKTEDRLDQRELDLLLGNLINEFQKAPDKVKDKFLERMFEYLMKSNGNSISESDSQLNTTEHDNNINTTDSKDELGSN